MFFIKPFVSRSRAEWPEGETARQCPRWRAPSGFERHSMIQQHGDIIANVDANMAA